jgi:hypothetical protein
MANITVTRIAQEHGSSDLILLPADVGSFIEGQDLGESFLICNEEMDEDKFFNLPEHEGF